MFFQRVWTWGNRFDGYEFFLLNVFFILFQYNFLYRISSRSYFVPNVASFKSLFQVNNLAFVSSKNIFRYKSQGSTYRQQLKQRFVGWVGNSWKWNISFSSCLVVVFFFSNTFHISCSNSSKIVRFTLEDLSIRYMKVIF